MNYTPLIEMSLPLPYFDRVAYSVQLEGIKVGSKLLPIPKSVLVPDHTGAGQTMVDSGSHFTFLLGPAYAALRTEFLNQTRGILTLLNEPDFVFQGAFDLCFRMPERSPIPRLPEVVLMFRGAEMSVTGDRLLYRVAGEKRGMDAVWCFTFGNSDLVPLAAYVIGHHHQQNVWVEYDLENGRVGTALTMENTSLSIHSFSSIEDLSAGILNLSKKRKCSNDLELPCPKHKCSYHGYYPVELSFKVDEGSSSSSTNIIKDTCCFITTADESDQHEVSDKEIGSGVVEDYGSIMVLDDDNNEQASNQYLTALGGCDANAFRNALFSLDSRCIKREKIHEITDFDNSSAGSIETDEQHQGHENVMLYSIAADARLGVKKPTIDLEFEQYFSLLML
ncbi:hypothetical protein J5N97_006151 [Dioscorea zingiberensis]|uniref:Peptidase A1 domain-containing protein n=1 Tax=Dioscorea zingiberensis TaxID=325984 RepID=A0A9D5HSI6_9LILI|nr:hypothetical protein J5N97_006151 [Dioscorea zingiberensis]